MTDRRIPSASAICVWLWSAAFLAGTAGLAMGYCLVEPLVAPATVHKALLAGFVLFVVSRVVLLVPLRAAGVRLWRWALDYLLIVAAIIWMLTDASRESLVLHLSAIYVFLNACVSAARYGTRALVEGLTSRGVSIGARRLFMGAVVVCLLGGAFLALPICWQGDYPVPAGTDVTMRYLGKHFLRCLFTATAAVTGTGLSVSDIGTDFSRIGHLVILALIQIGGLSVLVIGAAVGWRFRQAIGWGAPDDDVSAAGIRRMIRLSVMIMFALEVFGAAGIYAMWDPAVDSSFRAAEKRPALFDAAMSRKSAFSDLVDKTPIIQHGIDEARLLASVFTSVSAFCNCGLTLSRDGLIPYSRHWALYGMVLPLMILGGLGGPVLSELFKRITGQTGRGWSALSRDTGVTVALTLGVLAAGGGLLFIVESTRFLQNRYPSGTTPGALQVNLIHDAHADLPPDLSGNDSETAAAQRLGTMEPHWRLAASLYHFGAARGAGIRAARLDESSITPAGRLLLMGSMLMGGGFGGTAGGLRLIIVLVLLACIRSRRDLLWIGSPMEAQSRMRILQQASPPALFEELRTAARSSIALQAVATAAAIATALIGLIAVTSLVLVYREGGSFEECLFEAFSACCNVGLSTGLTPLLSIEGQILVILAMVIGKFIPLAILMRYLFDPLVQAEYELLSGRLHGVDGSVRLAEAPTRGFLGGEPAISSPLAER